MFSSKNFILLDLMFGFFDPFLFNFCLWCLKKKKKKKSPASVFCLWICSFPSTSIFVEKTILSPFNDIGTLVKSYLTIHVTVYFWALFHWPICLPLGQYYTFDYYSFLVSFEIKKCVSSNFVLLFKIVLAF